MLLERKNVLITGGTGTVGKELLKKMLTYNIHHIYVLSRDEQKQEIETRQFQNHPKVTFIIGDIRDYDTINTMMKGIDIVFHTAAMKIVRICEANPYETFLTNIIGTQNIIRSAAANNVKKVIFTSSDKAANPTSTMGISKLCAERLMSHANFMPGSSTIFTSVRFGNILGSRGSVLDLFIRQIKTKDHITLTHSDMSRFIFTIDEAVDFLLKSAEIAVGGEVLINKMPNVRIYDLAKVLIRHLAPRFSKNPDTIKIKIIGKHPSEKIYEELVTAHEAERTLEFDDYYCILPTTHRETWQQYHSVQGKAITREIASNTLAFMNEEDLLTFMLEKDLIKAAPNLQ